MTLVRTACAAALRSAAGLLSLRAAVRAGGLTDLLRRLGDLVFADGDREARWCGWTIERRHAGLARAYRDPLFDQLVRCPHCQGAGTTATGPQCAACAGTGRVVLDHPPIAHDG